MRDVPLTKDYFEGAVSVEAGDGWLSPWRLPVERRGLFPSPGDHLLAMAEMASGARLRFRTDARRVRLEFLPLPPVLPQCGRPAFVLDLTRDGELLASGPVKEGGESAEFDGLPAGEKDLELWLPPDAPIRIRRLAVDDGAKCIAEADTRLRWVTYGSSLTHCVRAHGSARTWPAIVARRNRLNLTSLGFGGECCMDPTVAMVLRDLPAEVITLKVGINNIGGSLNARTFPAAVMGLVSVIREKRPLVPIGLVSPIAHPPRETEPNAVGYTLRDMRTAIRDVHRRLVEAGDRNLRYFDGLELFGPDLIAAYAADQLHPNGDGIEVQAERFDRIVMADLLPLAGKP